MDLLSVDWDLKLLITLFRFFEASNCLECLKLLRIVKLMELWCDIHLTASEKCKAVVRCHCTSSEICEATSGCHLRDSKICEARLGYQLTGSETYKIVRWRPVDSEIYEAMLRRHVTDHEVNKVTMEGYLPVSEICECCGGFPSYTVSCVLHVVITDRRNLKTSNLT